MICIWVKKKNVLGNDKGVTPRKDSAWLLFGMLLYPTFVLVNWIKLESTVTMFWNMVGNIFRINGGVGELSLELV